MLEWSCAVAGAVLTKVGYDGLSCLLIHPHWYIYSDKCVAVEHGPDLLNCPSPDFDCSVPDVDYMDFATCQSCLPILRRGHQEGIL